MIIKLTKAVPEMKIYGDYGKKSKVLKDLYDAIDTDQVRFSTNLNEEDLEKVESLKWLKLSHQGQNETATVLGCYNELARKFLLEGQVQAAEYLL